MKKTKNKVSVGITGGIGSGKTVVSRIFKILGIPVYDADSRAKFILNHDEDLKSQIISLFGQNAYLDNRLNNEWIASHVFSDAQKLNELNQLVHPRVGKDFTRWKSEQRRPPYVLKEAALLYESGSFKTLDKIIVVTAPEELRIQRVLKRDRHRTQEQVNEILRRQWPESKKRQSADFIISNDENHLIIPQVLFIHNQILEWTLVNNPDE